MNAADVLEQARTLGVRLRVEGDKIKARGPRPAVDLIMPAVRACKADLLRALAGPNSDESSGHWLVIRLAERVERWFTPPVSRAELAQRYPGAVLVALPSAIEPTEAQQELTAEDVAELDRLVQLVARAYDCPMEEIEEMRAAAARDPAGALTSFRAIAKGQGLRSAEPERVMPSDTYLALGKPAPVRGRTA